MSRFILRDEEGTKIRSCLLSQNKYGRTIGFMVKVLMIVVFLLLTALAVKRAWSIQDGVLPNSKTSYALDAVQHFQRRGLEKMMNDDQQQPIINMGKVAQIESSGNQNAVNQKSGATGLYQIAGALEDYNQNGPEEGNYDKGDLKNPIVNARIAHWYLNDRIPQLLTAKGVPVTDNHILMAYNWGPGNVSKWHKSGANPDLIPKETMDYLRKYHGVIK